MTRFHFVFLDGKEKVIEAESCKHYSGHAALTNARIYNDLKMVFETFERFNVGLYGLRYMWPER